MSNHRMMLICGVVGGWRELLCSRDPDHLGLHSWERPPITPAQLAAELRDRLDPALYAAIADLDHLFHAGLLPVIAAALREERARVSIVDADAAACIWHPPLAA